MKIGVCHANTFPPTAGIGQFAYKISQQLDHHEFHFFLRGDLSYESERHENLVIHKCPYAPLYPLNNHFHRYFVDKRIETVNPDLLHLHSPISPPTKLDLPTVTTIHTPLRTAVQARPDRSFGEIFHRAQAWIGRRIENHLIYRADTVTTVSESVREDLRKHYDIGEDIRITPNGVDTDEFNPRGCVGSGKELLYTGRLDARKGLIDLLEALSILRRDGVDVNLTITGAGGFRERLEAEIAERQLEGRVHLAGFLPRKELIELYHESDILVFPSYYEGLPTTVMEAMAAGLPTVSTDVPGVRDLIAHRETGLLCPPGEAEEFAENLKEVVEDDELRREMGKAARRQAIREHDWGVVAEKMDAVYEEVEGTDL